MTVWHQLHQLWDYIGGNVVATPFCAALTAVGVVLFQRPIARWWHKHFGVRDEIAEVREIAQAAHHIVADLFEHHTGRRHELAPSRTADEKEKV